MFQGQCAPIFNHISTAAVSCWMCCCRLYSSDKKNGPTRVADFRAVFTAKHPYLFLGPETTYAVEQ